MDAIDDNGDDLGDNAWQLTFAGPARSPTWSPDGSRIAYHLGSTMRIVDVAPPHDHTELTSSVHPAWSPFLGPVAEVSPPSLSLGVVDIGSSSDPQSFTTANAGNGTLTVSDIASDNVAFSVAPDTLTIPFDLAGGASETVRVTFSPTVEGAQTTNITITHNAADVSTVVTASGTGTAAVGPLPDAVTVSDTQGALSSSVSIPIEIYDVNALAVVGVAVSLTYRSDILTPTSNAGVTTAVTPNAAVVPAEWSLEQAVETIDATTDQLNFSMAGDFSFPLTGPGTLVNIEFDVTTTAPGDPLGTTYPLQLTNVQLNEGAVSATPVHGSFILLELVYGDVTGNGAAGAYDAAWVLEHVANALLATDVTFPIEETAPVWASLPLPEVDADKVADVDVLDGIAAPDASLILQKEVGLIDLFPAETPAAPIADAVGLPYRLVAGATSVRPAERLTVSLDATAISELYAGELRLEFDASLLTPVEPSRRPSGNLGTPSPLFVQRQGEGQVAIVFASGRPMQGSDARVDVSFEASRAISEPTESAIRATHLRLNRSLIDTGFVYPFRIEPYRNRLMANYPNPFNPETWIPFELAEEADVTIRIYDLAGAHVRTLGLGALPTGEYAGRDRAVYWDGQNAQGERVSSGVYVYELAAGDYRSLRRMVVMK